MALALSVLALLTSLPSTRNVVVVVVVVVVLLLLLLLLLVAISTKAFSFHDRSS